MQKTHKKERTAARMIFFMRAAVFIILSFASYQFSSVPVIQYLYDPPLLQEVCRSVV
ncbi:hypothetical protein CLOSTHATH_03416 [Hungatella hathewayi DSM 13479]|uniref:Uncharacterized protein n=1 Tax=Hungatella hathewayi DSM 13479 TaxID=566550 RepID=D3AIH6_9FIRM|nr:hypothetical protein CLOSTHATH_03416 [Hungatella hathewayi DSM 13479]